MNKETTNFFKYKREDGVNPGCGFMSFQHFKGEKMYADIVANRENKMTETASVECYPGSADAVEIDSSEAYYPDSSVVYIRALWKDFEPVRGQYNYGFIQDILDKAKAHGQTLLFRLMQHSTRECDDVPEWLKELIDCPERPKGMRVKDSPTDPLFMELFYKAVQELGKHFDEDPYFDGIDVSFPGAWGEGYKLELYPEDILEKTVDVYVDTFPNTSLVIQSVRPALVKYANEKTVAGFRGDGLGNPYHMEKAYPPRFEELKDMWKKVPVMFECFWWMCEWKRQGWDIDYIINKTLEWHITSFNAKSMPVPPEWKDKIEAWESKMGYHFMIDSFTGYESVKKGESAVFELNIENLGVAPCYKAHPLKLRFSGNGGEYVFDTGIDVRHWLPGKHSESITVNFGEEMPSGSYDIEIFFETVTGQTVYFCCDAQRNGKFYKIGKVDICNI